MSRPFDHLDVIFDSFLQELPADYRELAIEFKAFAQSCKIKTPAQLLQVVMSYCGLDAVLREMEDAMQSWLQACQAMGRTLPEPMVKARQAA